MLFQVLCGFEPIFYTTHPNEEPINLAVFGITKVCYTNKERAPLNIPGIVERIRECRELF